MAQEAKKIEYYLTIGGKAPFEDWLQSLKDPVAHARILGRLDRMEKGNLGDHRPVGEGVHEMRIHFGPGYRVYFGEADKTLVILVMGGDKSTQQKDIQRAKEHWQDYRRRHESQAHETLSRKPTSEP